MKTTILHLKFGHYGGAEIYTLQVAQALGNLGIEVNALSTRISRAASEVEGIPHRALLRGGWVRKFFQKKLNSYYLYRMMPEITSACDFVIVGHVNLLGPAIRYCRRIGMPVLLICYGIDIWRTSPPKELDALISCRKIIALSRYTADKIGERLTSGNKDISVIHPMVDTDLFRPSRYPADSKPLTILTVSRLAKNEAYKGHDLIIRSLPGLQSRLGEKVRYVIVGDGDDRPRLEGIVSSLKLEEQVIFAGAVWGEERIRYYQQCHVFAMPSYVSQKAGDQWTGEGFGIVYAEASASERPVLACRVGGQVDAICDGKTGILVDPTILSVEEGLYSILSDLPCAEKMGKSGRQFVMNHFTRSQFQSKWGALTDEISRRL